MDERALKNRFAELSARAARQGRWIYSEFLTPAEQALLTALRLDTPFTLEGGAPEAERRLAAFGDEALCGCPPAPPLACLCIRPRAPRFAEDLGHRDFLGALMSLGLRREVLGDIYVQDSRAWLLCLDSVADYVQEALTQVRHTAVTVEPAEALPPEAAPVPAPRRLAVASERLDALIAAVYGLSRAESQLLLRQGRVCLDGRETDSAAQIPIPGVIVSVRGHGRFRYTGVEGDTRRGRLRVGVLVY